MIRPGSLRLVPDASMQSHPAAAIFPMMEGADFDALVADIKANGQREPIIVTDGQILDGRNRYRACQELGIQPETLDWSRRGTPEAFVISMNLHRRHLNESQRAMIAAKMANVKSGQRVDRLRESEGCEISQPIVSRNDAAKLLNVSASSVTAAKAVLGKGTPEEIEAIETGGAAVGTVARGIWAGQAPTKRKVKRDAPLGQRGGNPERIQRMQMQAEIWAKLSDAIIGLTSLPMPSDVAEIVNANPNRRRIVDERLERSLQWLKDFHASYRG